MISALLAQLDRELWLVTASAGPRRGGLIATFVSQASIVPEMPRMLVGLDRQHHTWELIEASGAFALHLLEEEHLDWVWRFGLRSGRAFDKLDGLDPRTAVSGSPILTKALGWLDCRVEARLDMGDRTVYLAEVLAGELVRSQPALTVKRMLQLAPPDKLGELKRQLDQDAAADKAAIAAWRSERETINRG
jgi:flavin reductase (DIM6/NTAB) family NADH-FMN oxidoreductase RutF